MSGTVRVGGVAVGRFQLVDGRPPDAAWMVRQMVEHFTPGTVPILSRHGGALLGYLDTLEVERDHDLRFTGTVADYPHIIERLRAGAPVSIEPCEGVEPTPALVSRAATLTASFAASYPHWRGVIVPGWQVVGLALSDAPASPQSVIWLDPEADASPPVAERSASETPYHVSSYWERTAHGQSRWTDLDWAARRSSAKQRGEHEGHHYTEEVPG